MLRRNPSLTEQARSHIKQLILDDAFSGGRIPSEVDLAEELGVSRTTIRDALSRLENEGAIFRRQGAGTFVNRPGLQIKSRLEEMWSYEEVLEAHGYTPSVRILEVKHRPATPAEAADLKLDPDAPLLQVVKLFLEDEEPVILARNLMAATLIEQPYSVADFSQPVYLLLEEKSQRRLAYYLSEIVPVAVAAEPAAQLKVRPGTPLITFDETGYDEENEPVLKATSYFRDDLLRLRLIRRQG